MTTDVQAPAFKRLYPRQARLGNGKTFDLRLMSAANRDEIIDLARTLPQQDVLFLRMDISDSRNVDEWVRNIEAGRTVTVLAYDAGTLAGWASLHYNDVLWTRHVGEIRTIVGTAYRGIRLGARLAEEIFTIAQELGLKKITAQMTSDQKGARATFERIGFRPEALLADHVVDTAGRTHDMLIMSYDIDGFHD
ncbi:MAG TPA: GNAT family N-acetyltransferase [Dehalococcoidia bacterium]|nr:GNAT family N-acetyltransferase [Dehalococcoidia bacterium]